MADTDTPSLETVFGSQRLNLYIIYKSIYFVCVRALVVIQ